MDSGNIIRTKAIIKSIAAEEEKNYIKIKPHKDLVYDESILNENKNKKFVIGINDYDELVKIDISKKIIVENDKLINLIFKVYDDKQIANLSLVKCDSSYKLKSICIGNDE